MPTLEEIAELANASRSTVSRVINNDPNVSEKTRQRVLAVIQQLNFQPNRAARSLAGGRTHVLGLVIPMGVTRLFADPYFPLLVQGVTSACNAHDYTVMLWLADPEFERRMISQVMHNGLIDGVLVASAVANDPLLAALSQGSLPFLVVGRPPALENVSYVDVDNVEGARRATAHLLRQGRRRVATITGPLNMVAGLERLEGYQAALREGGLQGDPAWVAEGDFTEAGGYAAMQALLPARPEAVFAASDALAFGALRALREAGRPVPEEVALVGFDDIPQAALADPPLTTVRQPIARTGLLAAETLIELMDHPGGELRRIILPTELVIRDSCGAATR